MLKLPANFVVIVLPRSTAYTTLVSRKVEIGCAGALTMKRGRRRARRNQRETRRSNSDLSSVRNKTDFISVQPKSQSQGLWAQVSSRVVSLIPRFNQGKPKDGFVVRWLVRGAWIGIGILVGIELLVHLVIVGDWIPKGN